MITLDQYYDATFDKWVTLLARMLHSREEAEDCIQDIWLGLHQRWEFCEGLIEKGDIDRYLWAAVTYQRARVFRKQYKQPPTVSIDADNIDFLSSIQGAGASMDNEATELADFYQEALKLLTSPRKLPSKCGFETVGEIQQYILVQYAQNGRTFKEIAKLVNITHQNVARYYKNIKTILTPMIEEFINRKLDVKN